MGGPVVLINAGAAAEAAANLSVRPGLTQLADARILAACEGGFWLRCLLQDAAAEQAIVEVLGWPTAGKGLSLCTLEFTAGAQTSAGRLGTHSGETWLEAHHCRTLAGLVWPRIRRVTNGQCLVHVPLPGVALVTARLDTLTSADKVLLYGGGLSDALDDLPAYEPQGRPADSPTGAGALNLVAATANNYAWLSDCQRFDLENYAGTGDIYVRLGGHSSDAASPTNYHYIVPAGQGRGFARPGYRVSLYCAANATHGTHFNLLGYA